MMRIGFACAYTPLTLIDAAGCAPYRVLPETEAPDQAGRIIHDNMCIHVKRILDRAMADDVPELGGLVMVNSCDAMRRATDGWRKIRPADRVFLVDLPPSPGVAADDWLTRELDRLRAQLAEWVGYPIGDDALRAAIARNNELSSLLKQARDRLRAGTLAGGSPALQRVYNVVGDGPLEGAIAAAKQLLERHGGGAEGVPVHLFGNVLPNPALLELIEECGARVVSDDLCTGTRLISDIPYDGSSPLEAIAAATMQRPPCARTIRYEHPGQLGADVVASARDAGARAVIAHVIKFCDPYLARMPTVRQACAEAGLPLLVLEGDCTLRSLGQQTTRIEALVEMLG